MNTIKEKEFIEEIAIQLTELNFQEETFEMDLERDEMGFTSESLQFYNERKKEIESLYNTLIKKTEIVSRCCGSDYEEVYSEMHDEDKLLCGECNEYCEEIEKYQNK